MKDSKNNSNAGLEGLATVIVALGFILVAYTVFSNGKSHEMELQTLKAEIKQLTEDSKICEKQKEALLNGVNAGRN